MTQLAKSMSISIADLSPEAQKRVKEHLAKEGKKAPAVRKPRERHAMPIDRVRSYAMKAMAVLADLSPSERARVLKQALKLNDV